ncbi:hypothetical protein [Actinoplanes flavus]|uniref:Chromosome segregation ATPase n=1 Tax=Actinoplanes flavus TaxID=2820290 RepID=A0ABS3UCV3_9ACTN|nr:hypothetical protein [Actinoplanes flavus]MBO3736605.1 hypothetical protein [Actinoplanes flavus]
MEVPHNDPFRGHRKVLLGACLSKPAGAGPDEDVKELLWSAHSVHADLTLAGLAVRGEDGGLRDAKQWAAWLKEQRLAHPDAEITMETDQGEWGKHLRETLRIDVDFVRTWLLAMNQDEGAADHVFTYASSRSFLNSIVGAVADPTLKQELAANLVRMGKDADTFSLDRRRQLFFTDVVGHTELLTQLMGDLDAQDGRRLAMLDALLATQARIEGEQRVGEISLTTAKERHTAVTGERTTAEREHRRAVARWQQAELQRDRIAHQQAVLLAETERGRYTEAQQRVEAARVAALIAQKRAHDTNIDGIQRMLRERAGESEPLRQIAAAAVRSWHAQVTADIAQEQAAVTEAQAGHRQADQAVDQVTKASAAAGAAISDANARETSAISQLDRIQRQRAAAVCKGDLGDGEPAADALDRVRQESERLRDTCETIEAALAEARSEVTQADSAVRKLSGQHKDAKSTLEAATKTRQQVQDATDDLARDVESSGLIDLDPVVLNDHADTIIAVLQAVAERANQDHLRAAERAAAARRATQSLESRGLLPARADIAEICEDLRRRGLGARPGWDFLATLDEAVALRGATSHPGLADGIVVTIPEDLPKVVAHLRGHRDVLTGPIVVGAPDAFDLDPDASRQDQQPEAVIEVVLPHEAFWSVSAGALQLAERRNDESGHERATVTSRRLYDQAVQLRREVNRWQSEIGPERLQQAEDGVQATQGILNEIKGQLDDAETHRTKVGKHRDEVAVRLGEAGKLQRTCDLRLERLTSLASSLAEEPSLRAALDQSRTDLAEARRVQKQAAQDLEASKQMREARFEEIGERQLAVGRLRHELAEADAAAAGVLQPEDAGTDVEVTADRAALAQQTRDAIDRWKGALTDDQLTAQLNLATIQLRTVEERLQPEPEEIRAAASVLVKQHPTRTPADFDTETERLRKEVERLGILVGSRESNRDQRKAQFDATTAKYRTITFQDTLTDEQCSNDPVTAEAILTTLSEKETAAKEAVTAAVGIEAQVAKMVTTIADRQQVLANVASTIDGKVSLLAAGQLLTETIDLEDRRFTLNAEAVLATAPTTVITLISSVQASGSTEELRTRTQASVEAVAAAVENIVKAVREVHARAEDRLNRLAHSLDTVAEEVVAGERVAQVLRRSRGAILARLAVRHHHDLVNRRDSTAHHVATFEERLGRLADIAHSSIERLRRSVQMTVRDSVLPDTPAMGRWAGLPLLKLSGLDALNTEQRRAAILATLTRWFDPELHGRRRAFDTDETMFELLESITPRFSAKILIPSDPLDPEHKPVEQVAMETSGGEGVTVALILASLLAARRATAHGYRRTTLLLDNAFAKLTKPAFLRLARDVATSLNVSLVVLTGIKDNGALTVFPTVVQLRVSRRSTANFVVPAGVDDSRLQDLVRGGALYASAVEWQAAHDDTGEAGVWPVMSSATVAFDEQLALDMPDPADTDNTPADELTDDGDAA